ncbi:MAG: arsenate-mycothiol transferase ArsC [Acidimicrobiales bacterium]
MPQIRLVILCSGNAARSVMAGAALTELMPDAHVSTAGTHVIEGQPMSQRTKLALESVGLSAVGHRSRQVRPEQLAAADLVIALAPEHVRWIRVNHPDAAPRTATLKRLTRELANHDITDLHLEEVELDDWEEIEDPAGGEQPQFDACAREVADLVGLLAAELARRRPS